MRRLKEDGNKVRRGKEGKHVFGESRFVKSEKKEMSRKRLKKNLCRVEGWREFGWKKKVNKNNSFSKGEESGCWKRVLSLERVIKIENNVRETERGKNGHR